MTPPGPAAEAERLVALRRYRILDTEPEPIFDDIVRLAAGLCRAPIGFLAFVDEARTWRKAAWGWPERESARATSFCGQAITQQGLFEVPDALRDPRFAANPMVSGEAGVRFYAGAPLVTSDGHPIGVLCVLDREARMLDPEQEEGLAALARMAMQAIELRLRLEEEAGRSERELEHSRTLLRAALESAANGVLVVDLAGKITLSNQRFAEMWGISPEILAARDDGRAIQSVLEQLHDPEGFVARVQELYSRPEAGSFDLIDLRDGRVFERYSQPLLLSGQIAGRVWTFHDISERTHAQRQLAAAYQISESAYSAATLADVFRQAHRAVESLMPARNFYIALLDPDQETISFPYWEDEFDPVPEPRRLGRGLTEYVLRTGKSLLAPPEVFEQIVASGEVEKIGAPSIDWLGVPLIAQRRTLGVLAVQSYTEGVRFSEQNLRMLEFVSTQVAAAIERKQGEEEQARQEDFLRQVIDTNPNSIFVKDREGRFVLVNRVMAESYGLKPMELIGRTDFEVHPDPEEAERFRRDDLEVLASGRAKVIPEEQVAGATAGETRWYHTVKVPLRNALGEATQVLGVAVDISERKALETQLLQAQRLEAIGRLAGGVAHDFNNLLTAILGYAELLERQLVAESPLRGEVAEIRKAGERAASLTRQLLAFSRRQVMRPELLDLNVVIRDLERMLRRLIGENIEIATDLEPTLGAVRADRGQLEQVIVNLAVNARDAMPETGGRLLVRTAMVEVGEDETVGFGERLPEGTYVRLAVADNGVGMDAATRAHLFEPFFTTKEMGTGLGLAMVYGIVKQSNGYIFVESEIGEGTTVRIYLPRVSGPVPRKGAPPPAVRAEAGGQETVLLVEDEEAVRELARRVLEDGGYRVIAAGDGGEALRLAETWDGEIDLLLTDIVMPELSGTEVAARLLARRPQTAVLYMSGYTNRATAAASLEKGSTRFLPKPFSPMGLLAMVRQALAGTTPGRG